MRVWPFVFSLLATGVLVVALNTPFKPAPALGPFFDPQEGFWQNAEASKADPGLALQFQEVSGPVNVYFDKDLIPHIFAQNETDAYFAQGYIHARDRLWQMDIQTRNASGRLAEVLGRYSGTTDLVRLDRYNRRLGMGYAAEQALKGMMANPETKAECDAYTEGVNAYIDGLTASTLPLEYKLLGYTPEAWTNLKTAELLEMMSLELAGSENDFEKTNARNIFSAAEYELLYPSLQDSIDPIVPKGTVLYDRKKDTPGIRPRLPLHVDSTYMMTSAGPLPYDYYKPDRENGSNNWAVSGAKTKSGYPILCNDPHLRLGLPSLWYQVQIHAPNLNVSGVSLPGAPGVIIGFNDSCAFGFTNAMRDVRDYFEIQFRDPTKKEYRYKGDWLPASFRIEDIRIKGEPDYYDTVAYTLFGPVMFEPEFPDPLVSGKYYACKWSAHKESNTLLCFRELDHSANYDDYLRAIQNLATPGQNCVFASRGGDIAIWDQGAFPAKWFRQGDFIMPGIDSSFDWQGYIPQPENPHLLNPARGFVSSANQLPVDPRAYPYYLGGHFPPYRGMEINRRLDAMNSITPEDMMRLQTDNYDLFAEMARPLFLRFIDTSTMEPAELGYYDMVRNWNLENNPEEKAPSIFHSWWASLKLAIYCDEFAVKTRLPYEMPEDQTLLEALLKDSTYKFVDDVKTPQVETLRQIATMAWKKIYPEMLQADNSNTLAWGRFKDTHVSHLTHLPALSDLHLNTGGGTYSINATREDHGPSWRMVVDLGDPIVAYGIYPGGQSGNPGSPYYDNFVDTWAKGKYDTLWIMKPGEQGDPRIQSTITFSKP